MKRLVVIDHRHPQGGWVIRTASKTIIVPSDSLAPKERPCQTCS